MHQQQRVTRRLLALAVAGLLLFATAACGSSGDDESSSGDSSSTTAAAGSSTDYGSTDTTSASASDTPAEPTAPVIEDFSFTPDPIEIVAGDSVTWTNRGQNTHTVTADDDSFDSGNIDAGATFEQSFDEVGDFTYHCNIHSSMTGTVTVTS